MYFRYILFGQAETLIENKFPAIVSAFAVLNKCSINGFYTFSKFSHVIAFIAMDFVCLFDLILNVPSTISVI